MRILAAAQHPGPAEAIGPVAAELRRLGHEVMLVGVRNDTPDTKVHGGSASIFQRQALPFVDLVEAGHTLDVTRVPQAFADSLISSFGPERIVVGCSVDESGEHMGIEELLVATGVRDSIRTVHIAEMWDVWFPRKERSFAHTYAVLDEFTEKIMVSRGAPPERVVVTGNPAFDVFAEAAAVRNSERRQELGLSDERLLVYFGQAVASNGAPDDHATLRWLIDAMQPTDRLIFCKHPRDDREYSHILKHADGRLVQSSWNSDQLLSVADVCLTHYSMMGLKSALLNFPTINLLLDDDLPDIRAMCGGFPLSLVGGSYEAHSPEALKVLLAGQLLGTASKVKSALHVDGKSTERVVRVVTGE